MRSLWALGFCASLLAACGSNGGKGDGGMSPDDGGPGTDSATGDGMDGATATDGSTPTSGLHVKLGTGGSPGHLVDGSGKTVTLHGVDRSGTEYACVNGSGIFDGTEDQTHVTQMKAWNINAVRVPLNEDCWLGINGIKADYAGQNYQSAIRAFVTLLEQNEMYVILDLHWAAPGTVQANGQLGMADADHAPTFWTQVATAYKGDADHVLFDLFNEPFITDWDCWMKGGACSVDYNMQTYTVAGMASLLQAVRNAGATNVVMMGGLGYSSQFDMWLKEVQSIPTLAAPLNGLSNKDIAVSWHTYSDQSEQTDCPTMYNGYSTSLMCSDGATTAMAYRVTDLLSAGYTFVIGEIGIGAYTDDISPYTMTQGGQLEAWLESMLTWADGQDQSYLAWNFNNDAPPQLLTNYDSATASPYFGVTYKAHLSKF